MPTLLDSYSETNYSGYAALRIGVDVFDRVWEYGQTFTPGSSMPLDSAKFYLQKVGVPTGNIRAELYRHSGTWGVAGYPTEYTPVAVSDYIDVSTLSTSFSLVNFNFSGINRINLTAGTHYCIVVNFSNDSNTDVVRVGNDASASSHAGNNFYRFENDGTWAPLYYGNDYDVIFYVYGGSATPPSNLISSFFNFFN